VAIRIQLLTGRHDRTAFDCGEPSLNDWLARTARQQQEKNYVRTRVIVADDKPFTILGFYSLVAHQIDRTQSRLPIARNSPNRLSCMLLARLAVDRGWQRQGLAKLMLADAISRTRTTIAEAAGIGLVVDALHEPAAAFYRAFGFVEFKDDPSRLFLRVDWP
jgi:GNAT superfamily N-acetyltransferase